MAIGLLDFNKNANGLGILNKNKSVVDSWLPLIALAYGNQNPQQGEPQPQFQGTNPAYQLPNNPINAAGTNLTPNTGDSSDSLARLMQSIAQLESGGNYGEMGPATKSGDRAYGRYQVMGANIPTWTKEVFGYSLTPEQFLASKEAQDAVARSKLGSYLKQYGNIDDAASVWFSGRPVKNNRSRDVLGTSVPQYVAQVRRNFYV